MLFLSVPILLQLSLSASYRPFNLLVDYAKLSKLIDSRDTDDSTVHKFKSFNAESGPGKWYTCKYRGDYGVIDDGITSLYTCTEEANLLIATFLSDKDFSPNQIEHFIRH